MTIHSLAVAAAKSLQSCPALCDPIDGSPLCSPVPGILQARTQSWHTPFPIWNQSVVPYPVLTVASWPPYGFLKRQVRWSGIPISFRIFQFIVSHTVKGFGMVNKAEIDVFLELSCFFDDPADTGNLISGFFAFSKTSLNIWKFTVHVLLKSGLEICTLLH